jgi:hypothetical protein
MNVCYLDGFLVNSQLTVAKDPADSHFFGLAMLGCNRIRCKQCKAWIRSAAGLNLAKPSEKIDVAALYETTDLATSPLLIASALFRLYLCRCHTWSEGSHRALNDPDADETFQSPGLPWKCDGHPLVELPHPFDGIVIEDGNLAELVRRSLHGWTPPDAYTEDRPRALWAIRMYVRLAQTKWQDVVARTAVSCLDDPEPAVRARALQFFFSLELPVGMQRALELLEGDRKLFAGVPDEVTQVEADKTLEDALWRVVYPLMKKPGRALELARADALAPGKGRHALFAALASNDAAWVAAHAEDMVRANPTLVANLIKIIRARFPPGVPKGPVLEKLRALQTTS